MIHIIGMGDEISIGYGFEIGRGVHVKVSLYPRIWKK